MTTLSPVAKGAPGNQTWHANYPVGKPLAEKMDYLSTHLIHVRLLEPTIALGKAWGEYNKTHESFLASKNEELLEES